MAELFGKRHDDVLKKIRNLECSTDFHLRNFAEMSQELEIGNGAKRSSRFYEMTKDGFIFVVMGFTGAKAAATKEAYINAFNWMAEQLSNQSHQGIRIPAPNGPDNTYCGRLLVSVEFDRITGCRPLPDDAFIATPATLSGHLHENWAITNEQLRTVAEACLSRLTERATLSRLYHKPIMLNL